MIRLDLGVAVGIYFLFALVFFITCWWILSRRKKTPDEWNMTDHIMRCSYCGHVFTDDRQGDSIKCPLCDSYLEA